MSWFLRPLVYGAEKIFKVPPFHPFIVQQRSLCSSMLNWGGCTS